MRSCLFKFSPLLIVCAMQLCLTTTIANATKQTTRDGFRIAFEEEPRVDGPNCLVISAYGMGRASERAELRFYHDSTAYANSHGVVLWSGSLNPPDTIVAKVDVGAITESRSQYFARFHFLDDSSRIRVARLSVLREGSDIFTSPGGFDRIALNRDQQARMRAEEARKRQTILVRGVLALAGVAMFVLFVAIMRIFRLRSQRKYREQLRIGEE